VLESAPESERWDPLPGSTGHKVPMALVKMKMTKAAMIINDWSKKASPGRNTTKCYKPQKMLKKVKVGA
jgi:hypothetical protein